jgi:2'-5' RNA ligase
MRRRVFVAIVPPPVARPALGTACERVADAATREQLDLRWTSPTQWHLTLAFLGEADPEPVLATLADLDVSAFALSLRGVGAFPRPRAARVLWLGVCDGRAELASLASLVRGRLPSADTESFRPHLTLARARVPVDVSAVVDPDLRVGDPWRVGEIVVVESTLQSDAARHEVLGHIRLR